MQLEAAYGPEWGTLTALLRDLRDELKDRYPDMPSRRDAVERLMETDVVRRLADGRRGRRPRPGADGPRDAGCRA